MNLPNKITLFRMVMVLVIVALLLFPYQALAIAVPTIFADVNLIYFIAMILFVIASGSDFLDGYLARKYKLVTNFGKFMDPIADKLLVNGLLIILMAPSVTASYAQNQMVMPTLAVFLMIGRDLIVDALRLLAIEQKRVLAANKWGKLKTVLQMIAIPAVLLNNWPFSLFLNFNVALILVYLAAAVSLISGIIYVVQNRDVLGGNK